MKVYAFDIVSSGIGPTLVRTQRKQNTICNVRSTLSKIALPFVPILQCSVSLVSSHLSAAGIF